MCKVVFCDSVLSTLHVSISYDTRSMILAILIYLVERLRESERRCTCASYFRSSRTYLVPSSPRGPRGTTFRMPLVSYETALSITLTLSLLCFARRNPVRRRCSFGIPFAVEELVPFSRHWFHCRPAHSLLWPALLSSFNGSRKTFQIPRDDQPIFIALLGILDLLYFVLISLYL